MTKTKKVQAGVPATRRVGTIPVPEIGEAIEHEGVVGIRRRDGFSAKLRPDHRQAKVLPFPNAGPAT